jgi:pseudaminic acid synthase
MRGVAELIQLQHHQISATSKPVVVVELSGNHGQSLSVAKQMIQAAADAGADGIKLQTYKAETMTINCDQDDFLIQEKDSLWHGEKLFDLYAKAATPWEWHQELFEFAHHLGMFAFSSPFDDTAVSFLQSLDMPIYKLASFELTDIPLIESIASTQCPVVMSTGMASIEEIESALTAHRAISQSPVVLLKCTSTYPASHSEINLKTIADMQQRFGCLVGLSDHTRGIGTAIASVALGACFIEKHFVLDRSAGGVDAEFSIEPDELAILVQEVNNAWLAMGQVHYGGSDNEQKAKQYRRSIYIKSSIKKGDVLTEDNIQIVRPAFGLAPKYWQQVLGKKALKNVEIGTPLSWDLVDKES